MNIRFSKLATLFKQNKTHNVNYVHMWEPYKDMRLLDWLILPSKMLLVSNKFPKKTSLVLERTLLCEKDNLHITFTF